MSKETGCEYGFVYALYALTILYHGLNKLQAIV